MDLEAVPCPLCKEEHIFIEVPVPGPDLHIHKYGDLYSGLARSKWKVCGRCGFVHQNPRPSTVALNEFYLTAQYHTEPAGANSEDYLKFARWYFGEKIDYSLAHAHLERGRVFDIGCGQGGVLKLFEERGWKPYGVEPDGTLSAYATKELGLTGVRQGILDRRFEPEEKVDLVFSNHAFEHFADLDGVMGGVLRVLKPGGYLFIVVPTYFKNKSAMSKRWMNSSHYSLFTHNSLNSVLTRYGFEEVTHTYAGWNKEVDDLWYLAKFSGRVGEPGGHFEDPRRVIRYLRVVNPLRSIVFSPIYSNWALRVKVYTRLTRALGLLVSSPSMFLQKVFNRFLRNSLLFPGGRH